MKINRIPKEVLENYGFSIKYPKRHKWELKKDDVIIVYNDKDHEPEIYGYPDPESNRKEKLKKVNVIEKVKEIRSDLEEKQTNYEPPKRKKTINHRLEHQRNHQMRLNLTEEDLEKIKEVFEDMVKRPFEEIFQNNKIYLNLNIFPRKHHTEPKKRDKAIDIQELDRNNQK